MCPATSATAVTTAATSTQISAAVLQKQQQSQQQLGQAMIGLIQQAASISPAGVGTQVDTAG